MNTKKSSALFVLGLILLAACAPAASPRPQEVVKTVVVTENVLREGEIVVETQVVEAMVVPEVAAARPIATQMAPNFPPPVPPVPPSGEPLPYPADNYFQDYGLNPYEDTYEDHLSTFALDVDTASYSVARRYIMDGILPPDDAIRVEEFVNYFDPGYPMPEGVAFGVYADGAPSPFEEGTFIIRFGVQGYQVEEWARKAAALTFVIDVSGSMNRENRLELVKRSLQLLVERLRPDDSVAIVVYGSEARLVLPPTIGSDRESILHAIYRLQPEGSTNAEAGLIMGYQYAMQAYKPDGINRLILCSDGVANVGATGPDAILRRVRGYVEEGVTLTTVGFGMGNFNDILMEQLADDGDGFYAYVDTLEEARKIFVEDLTSTLQVIALDAKVQVDFNPDVVAYYRLIGYENRFIPDQEFRNDTVDAGEIGAGHSATALYAIRMHPGAQGRLATVQLRWEDPDTHKVTEINGNFNTWDLASHFAETDPHYQLAVVVAQYAELLRHNPWANTTTMDRVYQLAYPLAYNLSEDAEVLEFISLVGRATQLRH